MLFGIDLNMDPEFKRMLQEQFAKAEQYHTEELTIRWLFFALALGVAVYWMWKRK